MDDFEGDEIVICELCQVGVHQTCYGSELVSDGFSTLIEEDWYCAGCEEQWGLRTVFYPPVFANFDAFETENIREESGSTRVLGNRRRGYFLFIIIEFLLKFFY